MALSEGDFLVDSSTDILYDNDGERSNNPTSMIQVYTGSGKGKTTMSLGLALRALGQGKRVFLIQFLKKGRDCGEIKAARRFSKFKILQAGRKGWAKKDNVSLKDKQCAQKGLCAAQAAIEEKNYDLVILDELTIAVDFGHLQLKEVKKILKAAPESLEIVVTGRDAHPEILKLASLVSEIKEIKHYYKKGIVARVGIEY